MDTMRALRAHTRGGPETLVYESAPMPVPGPGEVLVSVHAGAITFDELTWDQTWTDATGRDRTPIIPSHEVSGSVDVLGSGVVDFTVGDEVYGLIDFDRDGAAAEFVTVPIGGLARKPSTVSHVEAAALPLAALTAWQALVDHAALSAGQTVLVHGGAGGVGAYAVQLAATLGANVIATARGTHADFVRELGAGRVIDFTNDAFEDTVRDVDVVIDTVGGDTMTRSFAVLRPGGHLVTLGAPPPEGEAEKFSVRATFFVVTPMPEQLVHLAELVDAGRLRAVVSSTYPLAEGRRAFESGPTDPQPGKTVLVVRPA